MGGGGGTNLVCDICGCASASKDRGGTHPVVSLQGVSFQVKVASFRKTESIRSFVAYYKYVLGSLVRRCPVPFNFPSNFLLFFWRKGESYEVGLKNLETTFQVDTENQTEILILKLSDCKRFSGTNWLFRRRKRRLLGTKRFRLGTKWRGRKWTPRVITILKASISSSWSEKKVRTTI